VAVVLVGPEGALRERVGRLRLPPGIPVEFQHASEVVDMSDHPGRAMRRKRDNSIRVCFELVKSGRASAMVSAGNSGAVMAGAIFVLGRPQGVERPAIISALPALGGSSILLDMGAVVDCKPIHLVQFALMGEVYARRVIGIARPRVALLSNGEEESKGNELTRAAAAALRRSSLRFAGYCEGRDLLTGDFNVIVADGFTGNVALKTMEGTARMMMDCLHASLRSSIASRVGGALARRALEGMWQSIDWREVGGAPLVGVCGVGFICHGRSDARAVENAVRRAGQAADTHFTDEIAAAVGPAAGLLADAEAEFTPLEVAAPPCAVQADA
jgi:glycerol-3-phosphate acyltransferase PlsX